MRKDELIASVQKLITKQSLTQDSLKFVHPKIVEGEISKAYNTILQQYYADDFNLTNAELDFFCKKYTADVEKDDDSEYYADLPAKVIQLKDNQGLRYVKPKGGNVSFIRTRENSLETLRNLPLYCCLKNAWYYLSGNKIMFDFPIPEHRLIEQVYVKLIPTFDEFDDEDNIQFPTGDVAAMQMILQLMGIRPTDNVNDDVK